MLSNEIQTRNFFHLILLILSHKESESEKRISTFSAFYRFLSYPLSTTSMQPKIVFKHQFNAEVKHQMFSLKLIL